VSVGIKSEQRRYVSPNILTGALLECEMSVFSLELNAEISLLVVGTLDGRIIEFST
jgi:hypothetical protein